MSATYEKATFSAHIKRTSRCSPTITQSVKLLKIPYYLCQDIPGFGPASCKIKKFIFRTRLKNPEKY